MKNAISIALSLFFIALIGGEKASASELNDCVNEYVNSYVRASRGIYPPSGQAKKYCNCAMASVASGDTLSKAIEMCTGMIKNLYR